MREIKFRCWIKPYYKFDKCKKDYRMIYPHLEKDDWYVIDCQSQTLMDGEGGRISDYKMYLQQFTGLKDKNGKEIYEGDIIDYGRAGKMVIEEPQSDSGMSDECIYGWVFGSRNVDPTRDGVVIGNIFENPNLLK